MCITFVAEGSSECCVDELESEVERLKQQREMLGSEVERLKQLVTPRSSFIPTANRTMPAWGNSGYSRCQLPFSWTELNKVTFIRYYSAVSPFFVLHLSCFIDDSYLFTISSLSSYCTFFVFMMCFIVSGVQGA